MARPIPRSLLIHRALHKRVTGLDGWDKPTYSAPVTLTHVLFQPTSKLITTKDNREVQLSTLMFFDCKNSEPIGITFALEDVIEADGKTYTVKVIDAPLDQRGTHHYEIGLC